MPVFLDLADLSSQNVSLQATNDNLTKQVGQLQQKALAHQKQMAKSSRETKKLNAKITKLSQSKTELEARLDGEEGKVVALKNRVKMLSEGGPAASSTDSAGDASRPEVSHLAT